MGFCLDVGGFEFGFVGCCDSSDVKSFSCSLRFLSGGGLVGGCPSDPEDLLGGGASASFGAPDRAFSDRATRSNPPRGARRIATLARSGQQACAGTCALRHHSRHNSAPALPPPSDDVRWGQSTPASSLIAREARPLAAASDLRRRLDRRWPRWRPT